MPWETVIEEAGIGRVRVLEGFLTEEETIWYFQHFAGPNSRIIRPSNPSLSEFDVDGVTFNMKCSMGTMHRGQKLCMAQGGGSEGYSFTGAKVRSQPMTEVEGQLLKKMNAATETHGNALLLNYYRSDVIDLTEEPPKYYIDSLGAHSDNEKDLVGGFVVGVAFMERATDVRLLRFRHKGTKERHDLWMKGGTLYVMEGSKFQQKWTHEVPKTKRKPACISATSRRFR